MLSFMNVSLAHVSHGATLWQSLGKATGLRLVLLLFAHSLLVFPVPVVQSSETSTVALAILLGILFIFLLLGTTMSSKSTSTWEGVERVSCSFCKISSGIFLCFLRSQSTGPYFVVFSAFLERNILWFCPITSV